MRKIVCVLMFAAMTMLGGCSDSSAAESTLRKSGYTNIEVGGWTPFACSDSDSFTTKFTATNPAGTNVSGVVCCGWMKSCTVRF